ncbi:hypothetical protein PV783_13615 [Chitinophaga sp. CC14]|uniref:hypothetical protein n=1 Tax=Chitinophaga sp. CC14 TaxID=3029199 RepID=UPI003B7B1472
MKNSKYGLMALVALVGLGSAFATKPAHFNGTTYYGVTDGNGGFTWSKVKPDPNLYNCVASTQFCTIHTINGYSPVAQVLPTALQATPTSNSKLYKRIPGTFR